MNFYFIFKKVSLRKIGIKCRTFIILKLLSPKPEETFFDKTKKKEKHIILYF